MSDTTQQYDGRLYTQPEVDRLIAQARIDELNRIDAANKGNGISFWFESAQEAGLNNGWRTMREYVPERIAELPQTLKDK